MPFSTIPEAIDDIRAGKMVVVVDDEDRENEGDLTIAAEKVTPDVINFMARHGRGLICLPMTGERLDELRIPLMVRDEQNSARFGTAFCVPIEAKQGTTTGISAADRARTVLAAIDPATRPTDLARPGHMFPLRAVPGGVLQRSGQTEAAVDLARLAGLYPAGVICEIMDEDGTMARVPSLEAFCADPRPEDGHREGPHPLSDEPREARPQDGRGEPADGLRPLQDPRLREPHRRRAPRGPHPGRHHGRRAGPGARPLPVPDRGHLRLLAVRLRRAAGPRAPA